MVERPSATPTQERVKFLKHPILAGKLLWTKKRISSAEKTQGQAERIMTLSQVPEAAKREAVHNNRVARTKLFDLRKHREELLRKAGKRDGGKAAETPSFRKSYTEGDDVFGGYDL